MNLKKYSKHLVIGLALTLSISGISFADNIGAESEDPNKVISTYAPVNKEAYGMFKAALSSAIAFDHDGWVEWDGNKKQAACKTIAIHSDTKEDAYHYSRARLEMFGSVRLDSGRKWGTGTTYAESGYGDQELQARTYYGD